MVGLRRNAERGLSLAFRNMAAKYLLQSTGGGLDRVHDIIHRLIKLRTRRNGNGRHSRQVSICSMGLVRDPKGLLRARTRRVTG